MVKMKYNLVQSDFKTLQEKTERYNMDVNKNVKAFTESLENFNLKKFDITEVEFCGGFWRIQTKLEGDIKAIYDEYFIIKEKLKKSDLPLNELSIFDYYTAYIVRPGAYGPKKYDNKNIVVKCGNTWRYGKDLSEARSKLAGEVLAELNKSSVNQQIIIKIMSDAKHTK